MTSSKVRERFPGVRLNVKFSSCGLVTSSIKSVEMSPLDVGIASTWLLFISSVRFDVTEMYVDSISMARRRVIFRELRSSGERTMDICGESEPTPSLDLSVYESVKSLADLLFCMVIWVTSRESSITVSLNVRLSHPALISRIKAVKIGATSSGMNTSTS